MSALALSLGLALSPLSASAAETASFGYECIAQMPSPAPMLEKVMPSVVSINVEGSTTVNTPRMPRNFQQFFGDNLRSARMVLLSRVRRRFARAADRAGQPGRRPAAEIYGVGSGASSLMPPKGMW